MARLQATSRSRWGNSGQKGNWVLGLCDPRRWLQKPAQSLSGLCPPPNMQAGPQLHSVCPCRLCFALLLQFPVAGGQLGPGFGASVAQRSAADLGII